MSSLFKHASIWVGVVFTCMSPAWGCSIQTTTKPFEPEPWRFRHKMRDGRIALLSKPVVKVDSIVRGRPSGDGSCSDLGMLSVSVEWPSESAYKLHEVGFFFQAENGLDPDLIFPLTPVQSEMRGNTMRFTFVWLDGSRRKTADLNFGVNVFAVNKGLEIGLPARVHIESKGQ